MNRLGVYSLDRGFPCGSSGKESACNVRDLGSIPGLERSPEEGKGYPFQYSGLEISKDWRVHVITNRNPFTHPLYISLPPIQESGFCRTMPWNLSEIITKGSLVCTGLKSDSIFTGSTLGLIFEVFRTFEILLLAVLEENEKQYYSLTQTVLV